MIVLQNVVCPTNLPARRLFFNPEIPQRNYRISFNNSLLSSLIFNRAMGTAFTFQEQITAPNIECVNAPGLMSKQQRFCKRNRDLMPSVAEGAHVGITECQWQFRGRRWNCTTVAGDDSVFGKVIEYGKYFIDYLTKYCVI